MGAEVQGHPIRNQPHEGSGKGSSSSLHGRLGTTNRIFIHRRGVALPPSGKVQNVVDRDVRINKRPHRRAELLRRVSAPRSPVAQLAQEGLSAPKPSRSICTGGS